MNLKNLALKLVAGVAVAVLVTEGSAFIREAFASRRNHIAVFSAAPGAERLLRESRYVLTGRVLASGSKFRDTIEIAVSGDWLLALRLNNRLTGLNLRNGSVRDFSAFLSTLHVGVEYHTIWAGRRQGEVFLGSPSRTFSQLSLTSEGIANDTHSFARPTDVLHSLPLAEERWVSDGLFQDGTTLLFNQLKGDSLRGGEAIRKPVFPGLSPFVSLEANRNAIAASPDGRRFAQAFWFAPLIHIYDNTGTLLHSTSAPVNVAQAFGEHLMRGDVRMRYLPQTTHCYISVAATSKRVIALFSGKTRHESGLKVEGSQLHVLAWDGRLIGVVNLDSPVSRLAASPEGELLRAIHREPDSAILEYRLPEPLQ